jgi:hypothetical protein
MASLSWISVFSSQGAQSARARGAKKAPCACAHERGQNEKKRKKNQNVCGGWTGADEGFDKQTKRVSVFFQISKGVRGAKRERSRPSKRPSGFRGAGREGRSLVKGGRGLGGGTLCARGCHVRISLISRARSGCGEEKGGGAAGGKNARRSERWSGEEDEWSARAELSVCWLGGGEGISVVVLVIDRWCAGCAFLGGACVCAK